MMDVILDVSIITLFTSVLAGIASGIITVFGAYNAGSFTSIAATKQHVGKLGKEDLAYREFVIAYQVAIVSFLAGFVIVLLQTLNFD